MTADSLDFAKAFIHCLVVRQAVGIASWTAFGTSLELLISRHSRFEHNGVHCVLLAVLSSALCVIHLFTGSRRSNWASAWSFVRTAL